MRKILLSVLALVLFTSFSARAPRADEFYTFVIKKQDQKAQNRWSLSDWLETRDKMRLMDLWLAIHSPSPYEFYIGGTYQFGDFSSGQRLPGWSFNTAAYASIFGIELEREVNQGTRWIGIVDLRVFGFHNQATNITIQAGLKNENNGTDSFRSPLLGVSLTFYVTKFVGIEGLYRHYFASTPTPSGVQYSANRYEAGGFIEFRALRIYGDYFWQPDVQTLSGSSLDFAHSGVQIGTRFYF